MIGSGGGDLCVCPSCCRGSWTSKADPFLWGRLPWAASLGRTQKASLNLRSQTSNSNTSQSHTPWCTWPVSSTRHSTPASQTNTTPRCSDHHLLSSGAPLAIEISGVAFHSKLLPRRRDSSYPSAIGSGGLSQPWPASIPSSRTSTTCER